MNTDSTPPAGLDEREQYIWMQGYACGQEASRTFIPTGMTVLDLVWALSNCPHDALVMIPERNGGAPSVVRSAGMHAPVYSDQPKPFVWILD